MMLKKRSQWFTMKRSGLMKAQFCELNARLLFWWCLDITHQDNSPNDITPRAEITSKEDITTREDITPNNYCQYYAKLWA